jgi:hypothetical protein
MLFYFDGRPVQIGDSVDFDGERRTVIEIIETKKQQINAGFDEPAVGFETDRLSEIYQSPGDRGWDGIVLIKRAANHSEFDPSPNATRTTGWSPAPHNYSHLKTGPESRFGRSADGRENHSDCQRH